MEQGNMKQPTIDETHGHQDNNNNGNNTDEESQAVRGNNESPPPTTATTYNPPKNEDSKMMHHHKSPGSSYSSSNDDEGYSEQHIDRNIDNRGTTRQQPPSLHDLQSESEPVSVGMGDDVRPEGGQARAMLQPGAFHIQGPGGGRDANISPTLDDNGSVQPDNSSVNDEVVAELVNDEVVAEPVPDDEPISYAIRMRDEDIEQAHVSRRTPSRRESFQAVVLDAAPVLSVTDPICLRGYHPNRLNEELNQEINENIKLFYYQRMAFRICILISMLGLGLGLGLGLNRSNNDGGNSDSTDGQQKGSSSTKEIITLHGEYEGQRMGASVAVTKGARTILVGSPEKIVGNPTGGLAQLFYLNRTTNHAYDEMTNVTSSTTTTSSSLLFSSQGDNALDYSGVSVATNPYGEALAIGYHTSRSDYSYAKVFGWNVSDMSYTQIGQTFYGEKVGDGFASSLSISCNTHGLMLLVGSLEGGYAQLWACAQEGTGYGPWSRLDEGMFTHDDATEVVVDMAGDKGRRVFLGIPGYANNTGIVLSYKVDPPKPSGLFSSVLTAEITEEKELSWSVDKWVQKDKELFMGMNEGDYFGASISTDKSGNFVVIGAVNGGYAKTLHMRSRESWRSLGTIEGGCSSVATGRISIGNSCRICENDINSTRIAIASNGKASIYQFNEDKDDWIQLGDSISSSDDDSCKDRTVDTDIAANGLYPITRKSNTMSVAMSPDSGSVAVGCPASDKLRGRVSVWKIPSAE